MGITHLHLEVLLQDAWSLGNQVLCMITEYHLVSHAQGSLSLSPVLPEVATELLPPIDKYTGGVGFHRTRCEGHGKSQDPPNRHLATLPQHGGGRVRPDSLPDSGCHLTHKGSSCGSASSSNDGQPHLRGGC